MGGISSTGSGCVGVGWAGSAAQAAGTTSNANGDLATNLCYLFRSIASETTGVFSPHASVLRAGPPSFFSDWGNAHSETVQSSTERQSNLCVTNRLFGPISGRPVLKPLLFMFFVFVTF